MKWTVFFLLALAVFSASIVLAVISAKKKYKSNRLIDTTKYLFAGTIMSSVILYLPIYLNEFNSMPGSSVEKGFFSFISSVYNMMRLFIIEGDFSFVSESLEGVTEWVSRGYSLLFSVLLILAPILTFGFVLSFFKNVLAYRRYMSNYRSDVYVFSELNEKALMLAEDVLKNNNKKRFIIFTDAFEKTGEQDSELAERAKELGAICFKKDIMSVNFAHHSKKSELNFFTISENETKNVTQALKIIDLFKDRENTNLYVFSTQPEAEALLASSFNSETAAPNIKVRRINEVRSLINRVLYEDGFEKIFCRASENADGIKEINAVILGMGKHGTEMTKALSWFCQMDGYRVEINSFDFDTLAEDKFISLCPELMSEKFNGVYGVDGEAEYKIKIHSGVDVGTKTFDDIVVSLPKTTYVFVSLGNDEKNIAVAMKLRSLFKRAGMYPQIHSIVYDTAKKEALTGIKNFKNEPYDIDFIGDRKSSYSESVIICSDIEEIALKRHTVWGAESEFWRYDYNYKSSIASAIHREMKIKCQIKGIEKTPAERKEDELWAIRKLEHRRWNAYMRSDGYVYAGTHEKSGRDDLAKKHHCLVPFDELSESDKKKDDD